MNESKSKLMFAHEEAPAWRARILMAAILIMASLGGNAQDTSNGIGYHGGPVMTSPHTVYIIWYGNWNGNSALTLLPSFIPALNGTPYFAINTTYENGSHTNASAAVTLGAQAFDNYSQTSLLSETGVRNVISSAMSRGAVPVDPNGVYFVLSSGDVNEIDSTHGEFCVNFCGFHGHASLFGNDIKYGFVGNPAPKCLNSPNIPKPCAPLNSQSSPNGNVGADLMASTISHELSETVTDPDLNAWFNPSNPSENADQCNLTFGTTFTTSNGSQANVSLAGRNFLIQQNWLNDGGGGCTMASSGNPFTYSSARDEFLACYGIAGRISSNCTDISDVNDKQTCFAVSTSTQSPCGSMTDRNMQLACYGIAFAPNFPSNCRDISNPQMQAFCYGASSGNTNPPPNCNDAANADTRALCLGMSLHDPTQCSSIANHNDRQFCLGVSSHDNSNCASISSCPNPDAQASCINNGGTWNWTSCSCSFSPPPSCDPTQQQSCIDNGGSWDPNTCTCSGGCGTQIICAQKQLGGQLQAAPFPPTKLTLRNPLPIARPLPRTAEQH
jgi:hypothetical protein